MTNAPHPERGVARLRVAALLVAALGLLAPACEDPNAVFTGLWKGEVRAEGLVEGYPSLRLGHYGLEVAGTVRFFKTSSEAVEVEQCPCLYVDHRRLDLGAREVVFTTTCGEAVPVEWRLAIRDDEETDQRWLEGTVRPADGSPGEQTIALRLVQTFIGDEERACDDAPP